MKRLGLGLVIGAMCALGGVSTANAATYCVNTASCVGGTVEPTLASALTAANAANDGDTVYVGAGTYTGDITLEQGTQLSGPQTGTATVAGTVQSNGGGLDHLTVDATGTGVRNGDGPSSLYQVIVKANVGLDVPKGALSAYDFVFLARGASPIGVRVGAPTSDGNPDTPAAGVMHGTLIAPAGSGTGASVYAATGDIAALSLNDVAFSGWATQVKRTGTPGAGGVDWKANLTTNYVALDPAKVSSSGPGDVTRQHELAAADTELDAAGVPLAGSPVVDAGDPSWTTNEPDIYGTRDPLDGDGNGSAIDDIGAAEYQAPGAPDPTQAKTYCVAYPSCPAGGIAEPTLDAAGAAVNADSGADTVLVGPGTFSTSILSLRAGTTLKGSGRDATTIAGALSTSHTTVSDLTVKVPAAATYGVSDSASTYFRVRIDGSAVTSDTAIGFLGDIGRSHLDQVTVTMAHGTGVTSDVVLTDVTIDAPIGIRALDYSVELHRVVIHANTGILLTARNVIGDNVVIFGTGANPVGISAHATDPSGRPGHAQPHDVLEPVGHRHGDRRAEPLLWSPSRDHAHEQRVLRVGDADPPRRHRVEPRERHGGLRGPRPREDHAERARDADQHSSGELGRHQARRRHRRAARGLGRHRRRRPVRGGEHRRLRRRAPDRRQRGRHRRRRPRRCGVQAGRATDAHPDRHREPDRSPRRRSRLPARPRHRQRPPRSSATRSPCCCTASASGASCSACAPAWCSTPTATARTARVPKRCSATPAAS